MVGKHGQKVQVDIDLEAIIEDEDISDGGDDIGEKLEEREGHAFRTLRRVLLEDCNSVWDALY